MTSRDQELLKEEDQ
jgi:hypothetical protein